MDTKIKPIKKRILVRKCTTGERRDGAYYIDNIAIPDSSADNCFWAEILDVSDDCKLFSRDDVGGFVYLPAWKPNHMNRVKDEDFVVKESLFTLSPKNGGAHPMIYR